MKSFRTWWVEQELGDEDPLDAFMAAEVAPEVHAKEAAEGAKKEAERQRLAAELAVSAHRFLVCGVLHLLSLDERPRMAKITLVSNAQSAQWPSVLCC